MHAQMEALSGLSVPLVRDDGERTKLRGEIENETDERKQDELRIDLDKALEKLHDSSVKVIER